MTVQLRTYLFFLQRVGIFIQEGSIRSSYRSWTFWYLASLGLAKASGTRLAEVPPRTLSGFSKVALSLRACAGGLCKLEYFDGAVQRLIGKVHCFSIAGRGGMWHPDAAW